MQELDCSHIFLIFKPVGQDAQRSLLSLCNSDRLVQIAGDVAVSTDSLPHELESREPTPYCPPPTPPELHLRLNPLPKDPSRGFVFGSKKECDVVLSGCPTVSREHFYIDFNWNSGLARLNNVSRNGTIIHVPGVENGTKTLKDEYPREVLLPSDQTRISVGALQFDICFPIRNEQQNQSFQENWKRFHLRCTQVNPDIGRIDIHLPTAVTQSAARRKGVHDEYVLHGPIGSGRFGEVLLVTGRGGKPFAAKRVFDNMSEIKLSLEIAHKHIVSFVDTIPDPKDPMLIMEYMHLGNLEQAHRNQELSSSEVESVLFQTLDALAYLHNQKTITHRDIKPENILVKDREPLMIKLCDFGVSAEHITHKSCLGTHLYAAPEIWGGRYSSSVDIWAIAVVVLQYTQGLPVWYHGITPQDWCSRIQNRAQLPWMGYKRLQPLVRQMLYPKYPLRPTAEESLMIMRSWPPPVKQVDEGRSLSELAAHSTYPNPQWKRIMPIQSEEAAKKAQNRHRTVRLVDSPAKETGGSKHDGVDLTPVKPRARKLAHRKQQANESSYRVTRSRSRSQKANPSP